LSPPHLRHPIPGSCSLEYRLQEVPNVLNPSASQLKPPVSLFTRKPLYIDMRGNSTMLTMWKRIFYTYVYSSEPSSLTSYTSPSSHASRPAVGLHHHVPAPRLAQAQASFPGAFSTTTVAHHHHLTQNIQITTQGPGRRRRCGAIKTVSGFGVEQPSAVLELTF